MLKLFQKGPQNPDDIVDEVQVETSLIVLTHPEGIKLLQEAAGQTLTEIQDKDGVDVWRTGAPQNQQETSIHEYVLRFKKPIDISNFNVKLKASKLNNSVREVEKTKETKKKQQEAKEQKEAEEKSKNANAKQQAANGKVPPTENAPRAYKKVPGQLIDVDPRDFQGVETPGVYQIFTDSEGTQFANITVKPRFGIGTYKKKRVYGNPAQIREAVEKASQGVTIKQLNAAGTEVKRQIGNLQTKKAQFKNAETNAAARLQTAQTGNEAAAISKRLSYLKDSLATIRKRASAKNSTLSRIEAKKEELASPEVNTNSAENAAPADEEETANNS